MQYGEQKIFLSRYRKVSTAIIFLLFALILIRGVALTESLAVSNFVPSLVLAAGFTYSLVYLPKYLNFTIEEEKKYVWNVKIRWLLSVLIVFSGVFYIRAFEKLPIFILLLAIFLATNFFFRIWLKKYRYDKQKLKVIAYTATISDTLVLSLIFNIFEIDWLSKLLLCGFSSHIAVQLGVFPAIALLTGIINLSLPDLSINGLLVVGSFLLRKLSIDQNRLNYANSVKSLVGFTTLPKEQVEELLLTSTGKLATDWHKKAPKTEEEVEKWYADNSTYYIYDLAQFHLSYKHIVFTLDIIKLAKSRVLDYGAGIGDLSIALAKEGREVTYFDVEGQSKKYAQWQAENFNVKLDFATSHRQLEDKKFDTIIVLDVLEHLYRPEEILDYLTEKLDEGGLMIVSAYFGATKAHPMHFDHKLDVEKYFLERRFHNAKSFWLKLSASESMRRPQMFVYQKRSGLKLAEIGLERAV